MNKCRVVSVLLAGVLAVSCGKRGSGQVPEFLNEPDFILAPGAYPLWFEFGAGGAVHIEDPAEASEPPYTPWPLARRGAGLLVQDGGLVMAVNRSGFLVFRGGAGARVGLYAISGGGRWEPFSVAALFPFGERAAALLYRDDFFSEPSGPLPEPRVLAPVEAARTMEALDIPAFAGFPSGEGWDLEQLQLGNDGLWHFRGVRKDRDMGERNYYSAADLSAAPEAGSVGAFQSAALPRKLDTAPPELAEVLKSLATAFGDGTFVVRAFSSRWPMPRFYAPDAAFLGGEVPEFLAYWDQQGAWALSPGGRGFWSVPGGTPGEFSLPVLPESYRYTGLALLGKTLIVLWEEQDGLLVGASGFMVLGPGHEGVPR